MWLQYSGLNKPSKSHIILTRVGTTTKRITRKIYKNYARIIYHFQMMCIVIYRLDVAPQKTAHFSIQNIGISNKQLVYKSFRSSYISPIMHDCLAFSDEELWSLLVHQGANLLWHLHWDRLMAAKLSCWVLAYRSGADIAALEWDWTGRYTANGLWNQAMDSFLLLLRKSASKSGVALGLEGLVIWQSRSSSCTSLLFLRMNFQRN